MTVDNQGRAGVVAGVLSSGRPPGLLPLELLSDRAPSPFGGSRVRLLFFAVALALVVGVPLTS